MGFQTLILDIEQIERWNMMEHRGTEWNIFNVPEFHKSLINSSLYFCSICSMHFALKKVCVVKF